MKSVNFFVMHPVNSISILKFSNLVVTGNSLDSSFKLLTLKEQLIEIGMIDKKGRLTFIPNIPIQNISSLGVERWKNLFDSPICCSTKSGEKLSEIKQSDYICKFRNFLSERQICVRTYLRGGYATYVACLSEYFEALVQEYLRLKSLPSDLFKEAIEAFKVQDLSAEIPMDVDWVDIVDNPNIPAGWLEQLLIEFLSDELGCTREKMKKEGFINLLIPKNGTPLFPVTSNHVNSSIGDPCDPLHRKTDRTIGQLEQKFMFPRDDLWIELSPSGSLCPQSHENFWQMVIDRLFTTVRITPSNKSIFHAGVKAIQLMSEGHQCIEEGCSLQEILDFAFSSESPHVYTYAAHANAKRRFGFLLNIYIHYSHTLYQLKKKIKENEIAPLKEALKFEAKQVELPKKFSSLLFDALERPEFPFASLYRFALLMTLYQDLSKEYKVEWENGSLVLHVGAYPIVFPKDCCFHQGDQFSFSSLFLSSQWEIRKRNECGLEKVFVSDDFERVLFELALQSQGMRLSDFFIDLLVIYLVKSTSQERERLSCYLSPWLSIGNNYPLDWIQGLLKYSYKHGMRLWHLSKSGLKDEQTKLALIKEIYISTALTYPNNTYAQLEEEQIPEELRMELLENLYQNSPISLEIKNKIGLDIQALLLNSFFNQERAELFLKLFSLDQAIDMIKQKIKKGLKESYFDAALLFQVCKDQLKDIPTFLQMYRAAHVYYPQDIPMYLALVKEWLYRLPLVERVNLVAEAGINETSMDSLLSIEGSEKEMIELMYEKGIVIFANRPIAGLMPLLQYHFPHEIKRKLFDCFLTKANALKKNEMVAFFHEMKAESDLGFEVISASQDLLNVKNISLLSLCISHFIFLRTTKKDYLSDPIFLQISKKIVDVSIKHPQLSKELIPFFNDFIWVRETFAEHTIFNMTKNWSENFSRQERKKIQEIIDFNYIIYPFNTILNARLKTIGMGTSIKPSLEVLFTKLAKGEVVRYIHFELALQLFKLGYQTQELSSDDHFLILKKNLHIATAFPFYGAATCAFADPIKHHLESLGYIDFPCEAAALKWNEGRNQVFKLWIRCLEMSQHPLHVEHAIRLKEEREFTILPFNILSQLPKLSTQLKITCARFMQEKISLEVLKQDIQGIYKKFLSVTSGNSISNAEDPCWTCIEHFLTFLQQKGLRLITYQVFSLLLEIWGTEREPPPFIENQKTYLERRKMVEEFILANRSKADFKGLMEDFISKGRYCIPNRDPVFEAMQLQDMDRALYLELLSLWRDLLSKSNDPYHKHHSNELCAYIGVYAAKVVLSNSASK